MIARLKIAIRVKLNNCPCLFHKRRLMKGEKINGTDGMPIFRCNLRGNGNIPAPAIDTVKERIIITGITLSLNTLQALNSPVIKAILKAEHKTNPAGFNYLNN